MLLYTSSFGSETNQMQCARVVELADSLDSGSSVQYARAGSSPASRTKRENPVSKRIQGFPFIPAREFKAVQIYTKILYEFDVRLYKFLL